MEHNRSHRNIRPLNSKTAEVENEQDLPHMVQSTFPIGPVDGSCLTVLHETATHSASVQDLEELKHDSTEDNQTHSDRTPLLIAVEEKYEEEAEKAVPLLGVNVSCTECTQIILEYNANQNLNKFLKFLLVASAKDGHMECLKMFLACNDDPNVGMKLRMIPLIVAARNDHPDCVKVLLDYSANQNLQIGKALKYALITAAKNGYVESLKVLLDCNFVLDFDKLQEILLMIAVLNGHTACVKILLNYHADPNFFMDEFLEESFFGAVESDHAEYENILRDYILKLPLKMDQSSETPLIAATMKGYIECAEILDDYSFYPLLKIELLQETPLLAAAKNGHTECVKLLLDSNADPSLRMDKFHETPLIAAVKNSHLECVKLLLDYKCDPNLSMLQFPMFPLIAAVKNGDTECVKFLLDYNADVDIQVRVSYIRGQVRPLHFAIYHDHSDCVKLLLDKIYCQYLTHALTSSDCVCPLYFAVQHGRHQCLKTLLSCGYPVNSVYVWDNGISVSMSGFQIPNNKFYGETAFSLAATFGDLVSMKLLLEYGANVNPVCFSIDGKLNYSVPPFFGAFSSSEVKPGFLIKHGCDISYHRENVPSNECLLYFLSDYDSTKDLLLWGSDPHLLFQKGSTIGQQYFVDCLVANIPWEKPGNILDILELLLVFTVVTEPVQSSFHAIYEYCRDKVQCPSKLYKDEYNTQRWNKILKKVDKPSSLKNLCRVEIRQLMIAEHGYAFFRKAIKCLYLPIILKQYLLYSELR